MKIIPTCLIIVALVMLAVVGVAVYFGFIPGLTNLFNANKPIDLGVSYTEVDLASGREKTQVKQSPLPADTNIKDSLNYEGSKDAEFSLTQEEIMAMMNNFPWAYFPLSDIQLRFNPDGTGETSAVVDKDKLASWLVAMGVPEEAKKYIEDFVKVLPQNIPVYVKGGASITNGKFDYFDIQAVKVMNFSVPGSTINQYLGQVQSYVETTLIPMNPEIQIDSASIKAGKGYFEGKLPEEEFSVR